MKHARLLLGVLLSASLPGAPRAPQEPERKLRITARVLDAAGQPLSKAGIVFGPADEVTTANALSHPEARCADDGSLEFTIVQPAEFLVPTALLIAAPGKVAFRFPHLQYLQQRALFRNESVLDLGGIRLSDGFTLSGRVRDRDGKPIAGARIRAVDCLTTYPWLAPSFGSQTITGGNGVFVLPSVFANAMAIAVAADGYYTRTLPSVDLGNPLDVQLEASGFVEGTVQDAEGRPFEGLVTVRYEFAGAEARPTRAEQGKFRLSVTTPCRFFLQAFDPVSGRTADSGLLPGPVAGVALRFGTPGERVFVVRAVDGATDKTVTPMRAAAFWFDGELNGNIEDMLGWSLRASGTDGRVWLEPQEHASKGVVHVVAEGYAPFLAQQVEWKDGEEYVARLALESRLEGRVVDAATGKPAGGVSVTCERVKNNEVRFGRQRPRPVPVLTAEDGSFTFRGLGQGAHELAVRRPGGTAMVSMRATLKAAEVRKELDLALPTGVTVTGRISGGKTAPGWKVVLAKPHEAPVDDPWTVGGNVLEAWNLEGAEPLVDGAFRFEHRAAGTEQLFLVVPLPPRQGAALKIPMTTVRIGKDDVAVDVDIGKYLPSAVTGKVSFAGAEFPSGRLAVVTTRVDKDNERWIDHNEQLRRRHWALVAADGTFEIPAAPGRYSLEAIDVATGVTLVKEGDPVLVVAGKPTKRDLRVLVVEATVQFEAEGKGRLGAERVQIRVGDANTNGPDITLFAGGQLGTPGVELAGMEAVRFFVPPGPVTLHVDVGAVLVGRNFQWGQQPHTEETFEAELGKVSALLMKLPPPSDPSAK